MPSSSSPQEEKFLDAAQVWDLEQLYADLAAIKQKPLSSTERICLRGLLCGLDPNGIAASLHRQAQGLRVDLTRGLYRYVAAITAGQVKNWRDVAVLLERQGYKRNDVLVQSIANAESSSVLSSSVPTLHHDWGDAPDVCVFFGRTEKLEQLEQWIVQDRCRIVSILGMAGVGKTRLSLKLGAGGIGKTDLSLKLAQGIQDQFQFVIWRSLLNAPPLPSLLTELVQFLAQQQEAPLSNDLGAGISKLLHYLKAHRCLLILDNAETILQGGTSAGHYREGYEGYGQLFQQLGTVPHQSCLLLTSREKHKEIAQLEGKARPVRSLNLDGLSVAEGIKIFSEIGNFSGSDAEWQTLIELYNGNPLALELAAKHIDEVFCGNISEFLKEGHPIFQDLRELLDWHFDRLSDNEQELVNWFTINRELLAPAELKEDVLTPAEREQVAATLQSLQRRLPLERNGNSFTLQPVLIEYVTERLIKQVCQEIQTGSLWLLSRYALLKAVAKEYVRDNQSRLILKPILERAIATLGSREKLEAQLQQLLAQLQKRLPVGSGYAAGNLINLLCHLQTDLTGYDFSHLTILQAYLQGVNLRQVSFAHCKFVKSVFTQTFGGVLSVTYSSDGTYLITGDSNGEIHLWDTTSGNKRMTCRGHKSWVWAVTSSPDGRLLASASDDNSVKLWDMETGDCLQTLSGHTSAANAVAFSPDGHLLASSSQDATIRLWHVNLSLQRSKEPIAQPFCTLQGLTQRIWSIAFSPDGQTLASGSEDHHIHLWNITTGNCYQTLQGHSGWVRSVAFDANGQLLASASSDGTLKLWDLEQGTCLKTFQGHTQEVTTAIFSPDGQSLASCSHDQIIKLWDIETGQCIKTLQGHSNRIWSIAFSPNGQSLASGGDDHAIKVWDVRTGQCIKTWKGHTNEILCLALHTEHALMATGHEDETIKLWDLKTGQVIKTLRGHRDRVWAVAFSPQSTETDANELNQAILVSGSGDNTIKVWNWKTGQCLQTFEGHTSWIWSLAFSPNSKQLVSGSYDATVKLWDIETGNCLKTLEGHQSSVVGVAFSPNGRQVASSSFDATIKLWDVETGHCTQTLQEHENSVWQVAFSSDGTTLASCSYDKTVKVWDMTTGKCKYTFEGHTAPVGALAFSPDGGYLASGSFDQTIKLWNLETGEYVQTLEGHQGIILSIQFYIRSCLAEDKETNLPGKMQNNDLILLSGSFDETIKFWNVETGRCLQTLRVPRPYEGMNIAGISGLTQAETVTLKALGAIEETR
ncbi:WD40 repeat domain-containing protein [Leptolyngbya sp. FACHB-711]|uniref:WD40 repeat domain-containing protein n=1 Tax=unclassified Leptolyngbya TaxID=2650499 RepID=UPI0016886B78|nr:WD40 repeat domain-containing protein [Leptolyngbya sp. FACHB-711]MBD2028165.1 WD40 repeat domain-containing protein [Leptolyngbya sp. FACHB-711]